MNMTNMLGQMGRMQQVIQNPQGVMNEHMLQQLIRENPQVWQQAQQMFAGKNHKQQVAAVRQLYKQKGMDLDTVAQQYGIQL